MATLLVLGVLMVAGLLMFAAVLAVLKFVLLLVFLPLKFALRIVLLPVRLAFGLLLLPVFALLAAVCGFGLLAGVFAVTIPLLPFAIVAFAVWLMVRKGRTATA